MTDVKKLLMKPAIEAIYGISRMDNCKVTGIDGIPGVNKLRLSADHFDFEFEAMYRTVSKALYPEELPAIHLITDKASYEIPQGSAYFEGKIYADSVNLQCFDIRFNRISQDGFNQEKDYFWRFVYPVGSNEWFLKISALPYYDDFGTSHFFNLMPIDLGGHKMNIFESNVDGNHWMVIESTEIISYVEMEHRVQSVIAALGFVIGKRYGDYRFHLASNEADFSQIIGISAIALQETKNCPYRILSTDNNAVELCLAGVPASNMPWMN